jgi:hypothetical protein
MLQKPLTTDSAPGTPHQQASVLWHRTLLGQHGGTTAFDSIQAVSRSRMRDR